MNGNESLMKASYHLLTAKEYFQDFRRDCLPEAKRRAATWVNKLNYVETDVLCSLTPESRERFRQEITQTSDPLFMDAISLKILQLPHDRREMLEAVLDGLLNGEEIKITQE